MWNFTFQNSCPPLSFPRLSSSDWLPWVGERGWGRYLSFLGDWQKPVRSRVFNLFESTTSSGQPAEWERQRESWVRLRKLSGGQYVNWAKLLFGRCILNSGFVLFVKHTWPPLRGILLHVRGPALSGPVRFCFVCIWQIYMYSFEGLFCNIGCL
jgi:hypothetical protein